MEILNPKLKWRKNFHQTNVAEITIIHHALHNKCTIQDVHQWHLERWKNEPGFGYHFFIGLDGKIWEGRGLKTQGCHTAGMNNKSWGICLEGCYTDYKNMTRKIVPQVQIDSLVWLCKKLNKPIGYHREYITGKDCPGKYFLKKKDLETLIKGYNLSELVEFVYKKGYITGKDYWMKKCVNDVDILQLFKNIRTKGL